MNFTQAISSGFRDYVGFSGRASRSEYWFWALFVVVGSICTSVLDLAVFPASAWSPLNTVFSLATILPSLAVGVRRLHDIDKSGFWLFLWSVPLVGWIILIVWATQKGNESGNRFGPDPLGTVNAVQDSAGG